MTQDIKNHNNNLWSLAVSCDSDWTLCLSGGRGWQVIRQTVIYSIYRVLHNTTSVLNNDTKCYFPSIKFNTEKLDCRLLILVWPELRSKSLTQATVWGYCEHALSLSDPWNSPPSPPPMSPHHWLLHILPTDSRPPGLAAKNLEGGDVLDQLPVGKNLVVSDFLSPLFSLETQHISLSMCALPLNPSLFCIKKTVPICVPMWPQLNSPYSLSAVERMQPGNKWKCDNNWSLPITCSARLFTRTLFPFLSVPPSPSPSHLLYTRPPVGSCEVFGGDESREETKKKKKWPESPLSLQDLILFALQLDTLAIKRWVSSSA